MKSFKKIFTLLIVAFVLILVNMPICADSTFTLTINDDRQNRTYEAYQIVVGDISGSAGSYALSNLSWGNGVTGKTGRLTNDELAALPANNAERSVIANYISSLTLNASNKYTSILKDGEYLIENLPAGWYIVKETTNTQNKDDFKSAFIATVVGDSVVNPKGSKTIVEKHVDDVNDSDSTIVSTLKDSADYDIGDSIPYTLTATLGADLTDYTTYKLVFHDSMSSGLTYEGITSVKIDDKDISSDKYIIATNADYGLDNPFDGGVLTITFNDVISLGAKANSKVVIKYNAKLNADAIIGSQGNPNKVYLEYSNNPGTEELGRTVEDKNIVFTYKVNVNKIKADKSPLTGADFTLYKQVSSTTTTAKTGAAIKANFNSNVNSEALQNDKYYVIAGVKSGSTTDSVFEFKGIDDGIYVLVETTIPSGYNAWESASFTVSAEHDLDSADPQLKSLSGGDLFTGEKGTANKDQGVLSTSIVNLSGSVLPTTGGIGTTIFHVAGAALAIGAAVILISKKRMNNN